MLKGTVIYESWPCKSPLCSSQCVSILSPGFHGSFDIKINSDGFVGKPSAKQGTSGAWNHNADSDWGVWAVTVGSLCQNSSGSYLSHCLDVTFSFSKCSFSLAAKSFPFASHWLRRLSQYFDWSHETPFNSYSFLALPLSSLRGWHASLYSCWRKLLRNTHHSAIRETKDCKGANASSPPVWHRAFCASYAGRNCIAVQKLEKLKMHSKKNNSSVLEIL